MSEIDRLLLLPGHIACRLQPKGRINRLSDVEFSVSSQFGEDAEPPTAGLIGDLVTSRSNVPRSCDIQSRKCLVSPRRSAFT
jgi:hypothetical protein